MRSNINVHSQEDFPNNVKWTRPSMQKNDLRCRKKHANVLIITIINRIGTIVVPEARGPFLKQENVLTILKIGTQNPTLNSIDKSII